MGKLARCIESLKSSLHIHGANGDKLLIVSVHIRDVDYFHFANTLSLASSLATWKLNAKTYLEAIHKSPEERLPQLSGWQPHFGRPWCNWVADIIADVDFFWIHDRKVSLVIVLYVELCVSVCSKTFLNPPSKEVTSRVYTPPICTHRPKQLQTERFSSGHSHTVHRLKATNVAHRKRDGLRLRWRHHVTKTWGIQD